ncbi:GNAT family N-acetyltransferase [Alteriqipengyuania lutimaris]|uniref:N-acetyltransferase n=1 Tax=Alteriqipengyuania lutimaris TaxID=1538146 RepID=A0A395LI93_9SPHN|nr:GNAT family N-acetyltransferase [Alteriqipengyuania lutimaris]MBB3034414.1 RimJ/RimL family protein N-acetyltransferase [Alteriqipengyuania lutimaris]RDS76688.1 N-acetyltransferase [Alteriqipengyuania lutimaris]
MAEWLLETERLRLRPIRPGDAELQIRHLNSVEATRHLGGPATLELIEEKHAKSMAFHAREGFGWMLVFERESGEPVGHCGLKRVDSEGAKNPGDVEIGWMIRQDRWRRGYASEAVRAVLRWAFVDHRVPQVVALTSYANEPSWRLMERLGMERRPDLDFEDPRFSPEDNPTILYALGREGWDAGESDAT